MRLTSLINQAKFLITGSLGQLGVPLTKNLRARFGAESVIVSDLSFKDKHSLPILREGPSVELDIRQTASIEEIVKKENVTCIIHLAALLSAIAEKNLSTAVNVNIHSIYPLFEVATKYKCKLFIPSTIGAFGPESPRILTPDVCVQRPRTIYGISKVYAELLGQYYNHRFGLDFRSLRYPGIISADSPPGGGTTDYAVDIFHHAINEGSYKCYLKKDTMLPMMHIDDCIRGTIDFIQADNERLTQRIYNIAGVSFTPQEITDAIRCHIPNFTLSESIDPVRQAIADSWPQSFDDSFAKLDWNWQHQYDLDNIVTFMLDSLRQPATTNKSEKTLNI